MHKKKVVQDLMDFLWHIGLPKIIDVISNTYICILVT